MIITKPPWRSLFWNHGRHSQNQLTTDKNHRGPKPGSVRASKRTSDDASRRVVMMQTQHE